MKKSLRCFLAAVVATVVLCGTPSAWAQWTTIALPNTTSWGNIAMGHLPDGRYLYGHNGSLSQQISFGSASTVSFTHNPFSGDIAFVTPSFAASGDWGTVLIYNYDGTNTSSSFTVIGNYQNYAGVERAGGLLLVGTNGSGGKSSLGYLTTSNTFTTLIDDISNNSGGLAMDANGDVWIADDDDLNIYRFTSAQIDAAIGGSPLTMSQGTFVTNLGVSGSLAVDITSNRLYAAGWQVNGIQVYDLSTNQMGTLVPGLANPNYQVMAFTDGTDRYIGWTNRSGWGGNDTVTYGYALADWVPIPEPSVAALLAVAGAIFWLRRKKTAIAGI